MSNSAGSAGICLKHRSGFPSRLLVIPCLWSHSGWELVLVTFQSLELDTKDQNVLPNPECGYLSLFYLWIIKVLQITEYYCHFSLIRVRHWGKISDKSLRIDICHFLSLEWDTVDKNLLQIPECGYLSLFYLWIKMSYTSLIITVTYLSFGWDTEEKYLTNPWELLFLTFLSLEWDNMDQNVLQKRLFVIFLSVDQNVLQILENYCHFSIVRLRKNILQIPENCYLSLFLSLEWDTVDRNVLQISENWDVPLFHCFSHGRCSKKAPITTPFAILCESHQYFFFHSISNKILVEYKSVSETLKILGEESEHPQK